MYKLGKHRGDAMISSIIAAVVTGALCFGIAKIVGTTMQSQSKVVSSVQVTTYADSRIQILKNTPYANLTPISKTEIKNLGEAGVKYYESVEFDEETTTEPIGKWATIKIYEDDKAKAVGKFRYFCLKDGAGGVPKGTVISWYGNLVDLPYGWHICDGSNGTPDLRDRFIVGAGSGYGLGATGGATEVKLVGTQIGDHYHAVGSYNFGHNNGDFLGLASKRTFNMPAGGGWIGWNGSGHSGHYSGPISTASCQQITSLAVATAAQEAHENRPPYYALYYIMKI